VAKSMLALKARNRSDVKLIADQPLSRFKFAPSALYELDSNLDPGALPQAVTSRAFGASRLLVNSLSN
jgi:hypothetical protein